MTTRVGSAVGTNTATPPTHAIGDFFIAVAFRDGSNTAPSLPTGQDWVDLTPGAGANTLGYRVAVKFATKTTEAVGTFTNATSLLLDVYRPATGKALNVGVIGTNTGASTTVNYPALTLLDTGGTSWVAGFAGHRSVDTSIETPPTGMSYVNGTVDATDEAALHDTNGPVSSWTSQNVSVGGTSSGWRSVVIEIREVATQAYDPGLGDDATYSDSNYTATDNGSAGQYRTAKPFVGLQYTETTLVAVDQAVKTWSMANLFDDAGAVFYWSGDGNIYGALGTPFNLGAGSNGDIIRRAYNAITGDLWLARNSGDWNNNPSADPATGTGGLNLNSTGYPPGSWVHASYLSNNSAAHHNAGQEAWTYTAPSGFTGPDEAAGGATYDEAISLGVSVDLAPAGAANMAVAISLAAQAAVSAAANAEFSASLALQAALDLAGSSQAAIDVSLILGVDAALAAIGKGAFSDAVTLAAALDLSPAAQRDLVGSIALGLALAQASHGSLSLGEALSLAGAAGLGAAGSVTADAAAAFAVSMDAAAAGALEGRTFDEALSLGVAALISSAAQTDLGAELQLSAEAAASAQSQGLHNLAIALGAAVSASVAAVQEFSQSLTFDVAPGLTASGARVITGSIDLAASAGMATSNTALLAAGVSFEATLDAEAASTLSLNEALSLSVAAVMSAVAETQNTIVSVTPLTGVLQRTIDLNGLPGLSGTLQISIRLTGRLN